MKSLYFVGVIVMSLLGLAVGQTPFPAAAGSQLVSLMTWLIPLMHAACVQAPCSFKALRS